MPEEILSTMMTLKGTQIDSKKSEKCLPTNKLRSEARDNHKLAPPASKKKDNCCNNSATKQDIPQKKKLAPFGGESKTSQHARNARSRGTLRPKAKSLSPKPSRFHSNDQLKHDRNENTTRKHISPHRRGGRKKNSTQQQNIQINPSLMTVIVNRVDLFDNFQAHTAFSSPSKEFNAAENVTDKEVRNASGNESSKSSSTSSVCSPVARYGFIDMDKNEDSGSSKDTVNDSSDQNHVSQQKKQANNHSLMKVAVMRVPVPKTGKNQALLKNLYKIKNKNLESSTNTQIKDVANPHPSSVVHDKYWAQRHRLFSRFDEGIQLDSEGWYSVTPEAIADHVAKRLGDSIPSIYKSSSEPYGGIVILDAFCGMGGNSIAFGKLPSDLISLVVCVDVDRKKLKMAAHNASLYNIPTNKLLLIESNSLFVMDQCYRDGDRSNDLVNWSNDDGHKTHEFRAVTRQQIQLLPEKPGKDSFVRKSSFEVHHPPLREKCAGYTIGGLDMLPPHIDAIFMDPPWGGIDYGAAGKNGYDLKRNMKINYYADLRKSKAPKVSNNSNLGVHTIKNIPERREKPAVIDGFSLLKMAAAATKSKFVIYDLPRNTNKGSLGNAALSAGYRGNIKLEEHYLNGRLKTVTAYLGRDFSTLITPTSAVS